MRVADHLRTGATLDDRAGVEEEDLVGYLFGEMYSWVTTAVARSLMTDMTSSTIDLAAGQAVGLQRAST